MKFNKNIALLLILLLACFFYIEGCGCSKKTEEGAEGEEAAAPAEGGEGGEAAPPQEAARTNAPPPPAAPPKAAAPPAAAKKDDKNASKTPVLKKQQVPDNRFLSIEFDTKEAALLPTFQTYASKARRNIFRDIKSSANLKKDATQAIDQAKKMIEKVLTMPAGSYTESLLKQAQENLKQAEDAFKSQNYLKARSVANKAGELAFDSIPKTNTPNNERASVEYNYKGYYSMGDERTAMLTKKDPDSGLEKLMMVRIGDIVSENLPRPISIESADGMQIKVTKIDYQIEDINEEALVISNITEKKPAMKIPISKTDASAASADKKKDGKENKDTSKTSTTTGSTGKTFTSNSSSSSSGGSSSTFNSTATPSITTPTVSTPK